MSDHSQHSITTDTDSEHPLFRVMIGMALLAGLFYFAVKAFDSIIDDVVDSKYKITANRFASSMNYIHKRWMTTGKPNELTLDYFIEQDLTTDITVQMNKQGWPLNVDEKDRKLNCLNLWMLFAYESNHAKSMMDLTTHLQIEEHATGCHFYNDTDNKNIFMFSYELTTGRIELKLEKDGG